MPTQIPTGSALAKKFFGVGLFANTQRKPSITKNLRGPMPTQADAETKHRGQSHPGMPIVETRDLSKGRGEEVSVDLFNITTAYPKMGDEKIEGKGSALTFSSMDVKINQYRFAVDRGGEMTQQRTVHNLRGIAMANLESLFARYEDQSSLVHMAGARGTQEGNDWVIPLSTHADFAKIMVNTVKAPSYNRHFVADSTNLVQGGLQLGSIDSTDLMKLEHLDALRAWIDDLEFPLQPVRLPGDPAADDEAMYVMLVSPRQYSSLITNSSGNVLRTFQQNALNRASYMGANKHPLFLGEVGMWNGILVKKMSRSIRFTASHSTNVVLVADRYTASETAQTVNAGLTAGYAIDRALLLGAQALGCAFGKHTGSGYHYSWSEKWLDHDNDLEVAGAGMGGKAKLRFSIPDGAGNTEPTDHGIVVLDTAVKL